MSSFEQEKWKLWWFWCMELMIWMYPCVLDVSMIVSSCSCWDIHEKWFRCMIYSVEIILAHVVKRNHESSALFWVFEKVVASTCFDEFCTEISHVYFVYFDIRIMRMRVDIMLVCLLANFSRKSYRILDYVKFCCMLDCLLHFLRLKNIKWT